MRIGVIGGGITGLVCAYYLARQGYRPVVFESRPYLGARGPRPSSQPALSSEQTRAEPSDSTPPTRRSQPPASHSGDGSDRDTRRSCALDPFPVTLTRTDTVTCGLVSELGLNQDLQWHSTRAGVFSNGSMYPLSSWGDILRYRALPWIDRLRIGSVAFTNIRLRNYARPLDSIQARDWFVETQGEDMYEAFWRPAIASRFGSRHVDDMPAYVAWQFLREELSGASRVVGALRGGVATLYRALAHAIVREGGELQLCTRVSHVHADEQRIVVDVGHGRIELDVAISAIKLPALAEIADSELGAALPPAERSPRMQRVTSLRIWRRGPSPLHGYYRMLMFDREAPLPVLIDGSPLLPQRERGDRSLTYLLRLDGEDDPAERLPDESIRKLGLETLQRLDPGLDASQIEDTAVFHWKSPDPIWTVDALDNPVPKQLGKTRIHICTAAQAYPRSASTEAIIMLARDCVSRVVREHSRG